jgi:hypothetical protein
MIVLSHVPLKITQYCWLIFKKNPLLLINMENKVIIREVLCIQSGVESFLPSRENIYNSTNILHVCYLLFKSKII